MGFELSPSDESVKMQVGKSRDHKHDTHKMERKTIKLNQKRNLEY